MSRSFGDKMGALAGVIADPEVSFAKKDKNGFMVIASDGVWEFLTNEYVVEIIKPFFI